jgi:hypothetical protein
MAHFAEIVLDNNNNLSVSRVLTVDNKDILDADNNEIETKGSELLQTLLGGEWKRTSYNTHSGVHSLDGTPFRKNYAGVGYTYDPVRDAFIPPQPYPSWTLNEDTCQWAAPTPHPEDDKKYSWDEATTSWKEVEEV